MEKLKTFKVISPEEWSKMQKNYCSKGKHKIRENSFGISFCVICGLISNKGAQLLQDNEKLLIK